MLVCLAAAHDAPAQTAAAKRAESIRGMAIDATNSAPLRRAAVTVSSSDRQIQMIFTDDFLL